jgi:hypothetical protein
MSMPWMKASVGMRALAAFGLLFVSQGTVDAADAVPRRPFTVRDSIEMWRFVEGPVFRPDGRAFAVLTQRGNLQSNETDAELRIGTQSAAGWDLRLAARLSADINGGNELDDHGRVIGRVFWSTDGRTLYFLGRDSGENRRLYAVHDAENAQPLTPVTLDVVSCEEDAGLLLCQTGPGIERGLAYAADPASSPDAVLGTGQALEDLLFPNARLAQRFSPTEFDLWTLRGAGMRRVGHVLGSYYTGAMTISPDHRRAIVVAHAQQIPAAWESLPVPAGAGAASPCRPLGCRPTAARNAGPASSRWSRSGTARHSASPKATARRSRNRRNSNGRGTARSWAPRGAAVRLTTASATDTGKRAARRHPRYARMERRP